MQSGPPKPESFLDMNLESQESQNVTPTVSEVMLSLPLDSGSETEAYTGGDHRMLLTRTVQEQHCKDPG